MWTWQDDSGKLTAAEPNIRGTEEEILPTTMTVEGKLYEDAHNLQMTADYFRSIEVNV
jgi:hypothetical protein